jgi:hypothetical protein
MLIGNGPGSSPRNFQLYITEGIQGKSILLDSDEKKIGVFGMSFLLALCHPHASRQKRTLSAEGTKIAVMMYGYLVVTRSQDAQVQVIL